MRSNVVVSVIEVLYSKQAPTLQRPRVLSWYLHVELGL